MRVRMYKIMRDGKRSKCYTELHRVTKIEKDDVWDEWVHIEQADGTRTYVSKDCYELEVFF